MSKDKDQKASVPKVTHVKIGETKKKKTKSFIDFAAEYSKNTQVEDENNRTEGPLKITEEKSFEVPSIIPVSSHKDKSKNTDEQAKHEETNTEKSKSNDGPEPKEKDEGNFFPRFLRKQSATDSEPKEPNLVKTPEAKEIKYLTTTDPKGKGNQPTETLSNLNSFSSIFNQDSAKIAGVKRVFKKSVSMMVISFVLFSVLAFLSLSLFSINPVWVILLQIFFVTFANIFYIVVADRSYIWISLGLQALIFLTAHSFIGQGFTIPTFISIVIIILLIYFGYTDVEKTQLSSRLFSINQITSDSVRMLSVAVSVILAIGTFNSILSSGNEGFLRDTIFENQFIVDHVIIGENLPGLNWLLLNGTRSFQGADDIIQAAGIPEEDPDSNLNLLSFIRSNYSLRNGEPIITEAEISNLRLDPSVDSEEEEAKLIRERAEEFRQEVYPRLPYNLDTILDSEKFKRVVEETYVYMVNDFDEGNNDNLPFLGNVELPLLPRGLILPGSLAMFVFITSMLLNYILRLFINLTTSIIWFILRKFDFARIDVENVEAEVVTI